MGEQGNGGVDTPTKNSLHDYREHIVEARQKMQEAYDKTIISLSGIALGLALTIAKDIGGANPKRIEWLYWAMGLWTLSLSLVLSSFFVSHAALGKVLKDIDNDTLDRRQPGGRLATITQIMNGSAGLLFIAGVVAMIVFVYKNTGD